MYDSRPFGIPPHTHVEYYAASDFFETEHVKSRYVDDGFHTVRLGHKCPVCSRYVNLAKQGARKHCDCGLWMEIHGNQLAIWSYS